MDARERRNAVILLCLLLATGVFETLGVASIMPFLYVLSDTSVIHKNRYISYVYRLMGFEETNSFLIFLGVIFFSIIVFVMLFRVISQYAILRFGNMRNYSIGKKLLQVYLSHPYDWFLNRNSSDLGKNLLVEVGSVTGTVLLPAIQAVAYSAIASGMIIMLLVVEPVIALLSAAFLGGAYALIYTVLSSYLGRIGADRVKANRERFQIVQEAFGGIKEIKVVGLEDEYVKRFGNPAKRLAKYSAMSNVVAQVPRYILEAMTFGGMVCIVVALLIFKGNNLLQAIPTIGVFALAGQRLLPALQQVYGNVTSMRYGKQALDDLCRDMDEAGRGSAPSVRRRLSAGETPIRLTEHMDIADVTYRYPKSDRYALKNVTLRIPARHTVGFVGSTGAGKTTIIDIILGLLSPDSGMISIDGKPVTQDNVTLWQRSLGYVPQQIFLSDDTVAANIALGIPKDGIDREMVEKSARIAELHEFVVNELPNGYDTMVGERGVRLSGGQRQRIGIARSLYHDPDVLIFDEATSALDNLTEMAVMKSLKNLGDSKTIILIAHRLSTVQDCDCIYMLDHGRLVSQGKYNELINSNDEFKKMAAVNE